MKSQDQDKTITGSDYGYDMQTRRTQTGSYLIHLIGGQIVIGSITHPVGEPVRIHAALTITSPYEVYAIPPEKDGDTNRIAITKYGTAAGVLPDCGVDKIMPGLNTLAITDVPREMFDHYIQALERDRINIQPTP